MSDVSARRSMITMCLFGLASLGGCGASPVTKPATVQAPADDTTYLVGVWSSSTTSYAAAAASGDAVRLDRDGTLHDGSWKAGAFSAIPNPGPSPNFVAKFDIDHAAGTIHFALDGADEYAHYTLEPPDHWKTQATDSTVVYYVRRR